MEHVFRSFERNQLMLDALAGFVTEQNRHTKPSEDGMPLDRQLAHVHNTRLWWLSTIDKEAEAALPESFVKEGDDYVPIDSLDDLRNYLQLSATAVVDVTKRLIDQGAEVVGPYDHPTYFLEHMLWHDGYHFALIHLALRNAGVEISEEWEEENVWGRWRDESRIWPPSS
jgi:uncharacterized damage-inducible protein DinB